MRLTRRTLLATATALFAVPVGADPARAAQGTTGEQILKTQGRYLPRWIEVLDGAAERERVLAMLGPEQAQHVEWILRDGITQYAAFVSDEAVALSEARLSTTAPPPSSDLVAEDAVDAIVRASTGRQVVMLNEAHVASRHRAFLARVIRALHAEGFRHLAAETFSEAAADLRSGDPVSRDHGWYVLDPVFAEAVREALNLGWKLIPYEQRADQRSAEPSLSDSATLVREQAQADNLRAALATDPEMRVLVYVGYGHLREGDEVFAKRFKRDSGVDPLTIAQAGVGAFGPHVEDAPPVRALLERFRPERPVILLKPGQAAASRETDAELTAEQTDLIVLHPALPDIDGRPSWLATDPVRNRVEVTVPSGPGPRLIQAVHADDPDPAIPADQFLIADHEGTAVLYLRAGNYRLRLETAEGFTPLGAIRITPDASA